MDDAQLAKLAAAADPTAWSTIYDRYADRLYDFCRSVVRDQPQAQDALHAAFLAAAARIGQLRDPSMLRPWLYALCRKQALARRRRRPLGRAHDEAGAETLTAARSDGSSYEVRHLRRMVWNAAGELPARDRALLDLHLRQGLEGQELAEALGTNPHQAGLLLQRVRQNAERSLSALLVARAGVRNCTELNALLAGWDGSLSPLLHKRVARHIDDCVACTEQRHRLMSPLALLSGVPLAPAPEHLRERVLGDIERARRPAPASAAARPDGAPPPPSRRRAAAVGGLLAALRAARERVVGFPAALRRSRAGLVAGAASLTAIAVVGTVLIAAARQDESANLGGTALRDARETMTSQTPTMTTAGTTAATTTEAPPTTTSTPVPTGRPRADLATKEVDFGPSATVAMVRFRNAGGRPLPWTLTSNSPAVTVKPANGTLPPGGTVDVNVVLDRGKISEGDFVSHLRLAAAGTTLVPVRAVENKPPEISDLVVVPAWLVAAPSGCTTARVSATVADETLVTVMLSWQQAGGPVTDVPMSGAAGRFTTSIGPPAGATGDIRWWIIATDQRGNAGRTTDRILEVRPTDAPCPS